MTPEEMRNRAHAVVNSLSALRPIDAMQVLSSAVSLLLNRKNTENRQLNKPVTGSEPNILSYPQRLCKIDQDLEIKEFIHSYSEPVSQKNLQKILVQKFGKKRSPSRSGLSRYLKKIYLKKLQKGSGQ